MKKFCMISIVLAAPAMAEDGPSFDCASAGSTAEDLVCAEPRLAAMDRDLAATYHAALGAADGLDAGSGEASATLKAMQRGWIKGRDECWKAGDPGDCVASAYLQRMAELTADWMLVEPFAEAAWQCGGTPANTVFVMYFETELPAIRVEYGDGVAAMVKSPSASGARYDGAFGRFFWETSGEAVFAWEEGVEQQCVLAAG